LSNDSIRKRHSNQTVTCVQISGFFISSATYSDIYHRSDNAPCLGFVPQVTVASVRILIQTISVQVVPSVNHSFTNYEVYHLQQFILTLPLAGCSSASREKCLIEIEI